MYSKLFIFTLCLFFGVCAVEKHAVVQTPKIQTASNNTKNIKMLVSIGIFDNSSNFLKGVFSNGEDRISNQAKLYLLQILNKWVFFSFIPLEFIRHITRKQIFQNKHKYQECKLCYNR